MNRTERFNRKKAEDTYLSIRVLLLALSVSERTYVANEIHRSFPPTQSEIEREVSRIAAAQIGSKQSASTGTAAGTRKRKASEGQQPQQPAAAAPKEKKRKQKPPIPTPINSNWKKDPRYTNWQKAVRSLREGKKNDLGEEWLVAQVQEVRRLKEAAYSFREELRQAMPTEGSRVVSTENVDSMQV